MRFNNTTSLDSHRLERMFSRHAEPWSHGRLTVSVRYSRGADFSGTCFYGRHLAYVNLGRHIEYPYPIRTHIARARSNRRYWWKEIYTVDAADGYQLALFVFLHEYYHWLIKRAKRNTRQKESMCDRFATRVLVDDYGALVRDDQGRPVARQDWDFQDLDGFVAAALPRQKPRPAARTVIQPVPAGQLLFRFLRGSH
ncbi:MAG: hypothetical protein JXQ73_32450 [Phycisphaerae bacterium]|nr:hypothetical protein [Phycisphaerae bacterium]